MIEPAPLQQIDRTYVLWRGRKLSYFSGCDYFRLSNHPTVRRALIDGLNRFGLNVAASRLTTGNHRLYLDLEQQVARFFKAQAALLLPSGYVANLAVAQALTRQFSHALIDESAHPSLRDAAVALECPILKFRHQSPADVATTVERCGNGCRPILLTDGMFSRDGAVAPLKEYLAALPRDARLLVDDAHGAGVLGKNGRGSLDQTGISRNRVIQTITLSKAFGVYGGAILCSAALRRRILGCSPLVVGSTPLPLPLVNAGSAALRILASDTSMRARLVHRTRYVREVLRTVGLAMPQTPGPIVALQARQPHSVIKIKQALLKAAIYPPFIIYPGGSVAGYFRFVISSEHTLTQLDNLSACLTGIAPLLSTLASDRSVET